MPDVAVTRIEDRNFQMFSCLQLANAQKDNLLINYSAIERLLEPLSEKNCEDSLIKNLRTKTAKFLVWLFHQSDQIVFLDKEDAKNIKGYTVCFHKVQDIAFGFLLHPLSDSDLRKIERESAGKTYFTGDPNDPIRTDKDFKH